MNDIVENRENTQLDRRSAIHQLEDVMMGMEEQVDLPVVHHFADKLYARELFIPAGTTLVGKIHKTEHLNILVKGTILIATEEGNSILEGPQVLVTGPGTKRVGHAITDSVWITVHGGVEGTDLDKLERDLIAPSFEALEHEQEQRLSSEEHF